MGNKEKNIRTEEEKRNEELSQMINERERRIQILNDEYEQNKKIRQQICGDIYIYRSSYIILIKPYAIICYYK